MGKATVMRLLVSGAIGAAIAAGTLGASAQAHADGVNGPTPFGCTARTDLWGFLGSQRRVLCDWPRRPDGSWTRERVFLIPAHHVPFTCDTYSGYYSSHTSCGGGYDVKTQILDDQTYPVTDATVLPDEPGFLG
ncbi:hypothetical protein SEA_NAIRB_39 [Mycobacterium phage Nairb]|uniref:CDGP domain-containing protein n=4 Tax=Bernalvirus bernal13 TaxID=1982102 RepID=A0A2P1JRQ1_9CAUD|nr:hypothetical protein PBI_RONRAYGUN_40 [Mycobacterium phage RonRayGun]ASJ79120.1 hypothetical protein SEA_ZENTIME222_39 [Mycobacterium phage ZenTime222]AVO21827.1 hypothetical protein SEA_NAIRB_39 [Mycobacterium phage Nairb]QBP28885.1 hypothetical protein SEA_IBRAHIM_40 [Mycobacterium phage Ibrahim]